MKVYKVHMIKLRPKTLQLGDYEKRKSIMTIG